MGAALSYYTVFSMAPTLLIVISVAGLIFGPDAVRGEIFAQLSDLMGPVAAVTIQQVLANLHQPNGVAGTIIGTILVLAGATSVFGELQNALDRIWRATAAESAGIFSLIRARLVSFGMILGIAFLLIVSLVLSAAIAGARSMVGRSVRALGAAGPDRQCDGRFCHHDGVLRRDLPLSFRG